MERSYFLVVMERDDHGEVVHFVDQYEIRTCTAYKASMGETEADRRPTIFVQDRTRPKKYEYIYFHMNRLPCFYDELLDIHGIGRDYSNDWRDFETIQWTD